MDDAENEQNPIFLDHVVHDAVVADAEPMEGVGDTLDSLDGLATDPPWFRGVIRELLDCGSNPCPSLWRELLQRTRGGGGELDLIRFQSRSFRLVVRPLA